MAATTSRKGYILSIVTLGALFFVFGLVSWVNSILVPYFKVSCELHSEAQSYLANFAFYISYLVMSIPSSVLLNKVGFRRACRYGLWVLAFGALLFVPAAMTRQYWLFLVALFTMGTSLSILQTTANPAVTVIGPLESASRRISIMGVCNKFAGIIAPLLFAALVIHPGDEAVMAAVQDGSLVGAAKDAALGSLIRNVIPPYIGLAVILFLFSLVFYRPVIPDINPSKENAAGAGEGTERSSILAYPYLVLGVLALLLHVGSQVISVNTVIGYGQSMGLTLSEAKIFPSATLFCILLGYTAGIALIPKRLSQQTALKICTVTGLVLSLCAVLIHGEVRFFGLTTDISIWFLVLLGIPNSLIYAGIWPLAIRRLGKWTNLGSSLLVMGLCGNAILPLVYAWVADRTGSLATAYWVLVPCFLYLIYYAFSGHKIEYWRKSK